jgi:hypothetical protein
MGVQSTLWPMDVGGTAAIISCLLMISLALIICICCGSSDEKKNKGDSKLADSKKGAKVSETSSPLSKNKDKSKLARTADEKKATTKDATAGKQNVSAVFVH